MRIRYRVKGVLVIKCLGMNIKIPILGLQSVSRDVADNVSHPRRLDPTMELIRYSFVLYLQHGRHDVKCNHQYVVLTVYTKLNIDN